ncbi:MAG TPA: bifunctional ADP-dependent NAD(P)H-hydrate dehydratase/NAD(P)H-hydrate epimerase [Verrucomicrobia bacterium]|nr:bifunctional ADP-dependent NAD(P)H-hydrate dehydratase/NAD(P)H-hydrate epimerase [Verrucomicrobiota bacterium]
MKAVSAAQMQKIDRLTTDSFGIPGEDLMERAGYCVADAVQRMIEAHNLLNPRITLFAGRGNNGGDVFVAARHLSEAGFAIGVLFAGDIDAVRGDALIHLQKLQAAEIPLHVMETVSEWDELLGTPYANSDILVDGLLGTGARGPARGPVARAIQVINRCSQKGLVVSVDIPSGMDPDTGQADGDVVVADLTVTFGLPKTGLLQPAALAYVGTVEVGDIGIPRELTDSVGGSLDLITPDMVSACLPRRLRHTHKGTFGHVLLIGGSPAFSGAISMAAMAACRSGAGLVSVLTPVSVAATVAGHEPQAMVHGGRENSRGSLSADAIEACFPAGGLDRFRAVLIGPGLTTHPDGVRLIHTVLSSTVPTVILDADALTLVANHQELLDGGRRGVILTPHPGEMSRLTGVDLETIEADRMAVARRVASQFGVVAVLKGAGTLVVTAERAGVNLTGNPGMATGGMGDALAGLMTGLGGQGIAPFEAACAAVWLHGVAGDEAAAMSSQSGLTTTALINALPRVFRRVQVR